MLKRLQQLWTNVARGAGPNGSVGPFPLAVGLLCVAGGLSGYLLIPESQAHAALSLEVRLEGRTVPKQVDVTSYAVELGRAYLKRPVVLTVGPWQFESTRAALGVQVDLEALTAMLEASRDQSSALRRFHLQERGDVPLDLSMPVRLEGNRAERWLLRIKDQVFQRARDARIDLRTNKLIPEQAGLALDVHGTLDVLADAVFRGQTRIAARVLTQKPARAQAVLKDLDFSAALGSFESRYNGMDSDRSFNLRVAARHVDGIVLMPGDVFDFNNIVGERSEANGFRPAPVIAGGELSDGVGGGTCQIAGTLHAAVFFAGLPFLERSTHSRPSSYLKLGLDATVSYPKLNFKFQNDTPYPLAVSVSVANGRVLAEIRGPARAQREVSFVRRIDKVQPYSEVKRDDPTLPSGVQVLAQRGVPGFEVTSFRLIREREREQVTRERRHDSYPPTTQIWRIGKGGAAPAGYVPPASDAHPEYRADEYLILTMGPSTQGLEETVRREGLTGFPGWTEKQGMPQVGKK